MTAIDQDSRIYVAGHRGLIGSAMFRRLEQAGYRQLITRDRAGLDLTDSPTTNRFFDENQPEYVILAAGHVGGIVENQRFPADFIMANLAIQVNVLNAAKRTGVRRLIFFASSCMYPRECPQPMAENALLTGRPESTSLSYAIAKLAGMQTCVANNLQEGISRFIPLIPNSVYGPNDNFNPESGHVLAALVRRFIEAERRQLPDVTLWGTGQPRREFLFVEDLVDACLRLLSEDISNLELPVNLGSGIDYSIAELAEKISGLVGYKGKLLWDASKPDGSPQKLLDSGRMTSWGWKANTCIDDGLRKTIDWYRSRIDVDNYSEIANLSDISLQKPYDWQGFSPG
jgi:GDP-L-fucose synthase